MNWLARQKFRFDLGQSFLALLNFAFVVIAASDKLATLCHLPAKALLAILVPGALLAVWLLGSCLDRARFYHAYTAELNRRNQLLQSLDRQNTALPRSTSTAGNPSATT